VSTRSQFQSSSVLEWQITNDDCRVPSDHRVRFDIRGDNSPGGHHSACAHRYAWQNQSIQANPCTIPNRDGLSDDIRGAALAAKANLMRPGMDHHSWREGYIFSDMAFAIEDEFDIWSDTSTFTNRKAFVPRTAMAAKNQRSEEGDSSGDVEPS
jgi:hypothetical protein